MKKVLPILLFVVIVIVGYMEKEIFLEWIHSGGSLAILISMVFVAILVFFPVMPFPVVAGMIGAVYGTWLGALISLLGAIMGSILMFWMARYGFREWAQRFLKKYPKAATYETYFEKNAFVSILFVRAVPVIPAPVVNIVCGLSRVSWVTFFIASLIGKIPSNLVFSFAGSSFGSSKITSFLVYGIYYLLIFGLMFLTIRRQQNRNPQ